MISILANILTLLAKFLSNFHSLQLQSSLQNLDCPLCRLCGSHHTIKNGSTHNRKPKRQCKDCGHQFVINPTNRTVSAEIKQSIDRLLLECISLRGIVRVTGVSWSWLQNYVNNKYSSVPHYISVTEKARGKLIMECDELWSFVFSKK